MSQPSARPSAVIVLAAGQGTRMKSTTPKIMHAIGGRSLVGHALAAAWSLAPEHLVAVVRHERARVAEHIETVAAQLGIDALAIADQDDVPGTGRAVELGLAALPADLEGTVVVTYGDVPLLTPETLARLVADHEADGNAVTVLTATLEDATGYGRIVRDAEGLVERIMEHKDALAHAESTGDDSFVAIREVNSGIYAFDAALLRRTLPEVSTDNVQGEKYLTDVLGMARAEGGRVASVGTDDVWEVEGANDRRQLSDLGRQLNDRVLRGWMKEGVTVVDPSSTWVDVTVSLASDVTLKPGTQLHGATSVATGAVVGPDSTLTDTQVGEGAVVKRTDATEAVIGAGATSGGAMDASNLLKPALAGGKLRCMGSTTYKEYRQHFEKDRALSRRFQKIDVNEPSVADTIKILMGLKPSFEKHHDLRYTSEAIKTAVELASRYINDRKLPDKAIDVIDESGAAQMLVAESKRKKTIGIKEIETTIATMARIPPRRCAAGPPRAGSRSPRRRSPGSTTRISTAPTTSQRLPRRSRARRSRSCSHTPRNPIARLRRPAST